MTASEPSQLDSIIEEIKDIHYRYSSNKCKTHGFNLSGCIGLTGFFTVAKNEGCEIERHFGTCVTCTEEYEYPCRTLKAIGVTK